MSDSIAFFDIAGTVVEGNPWDFVRAHSAIDSGRMRAALWRFLPVWFGTKVGLLHDSVFRDRWLKRMAGIFKGWSSEQLQVFFTEILTDDMSRLYREDVVERLKQHRQQGQQVVLVSGMFDVMVQIVAQHVGADVAIGTRLAMRDGVCVGSVDGETCVGLRKLAFIRRYLQDQAHDFDLTTCYGYADSFSDVPLLEAVGHGVAVYPDAELRAYAVDREWEILPV